MARLDAHWRALHCNAAGAAVPACDTPPIAKIGVPPQHGLNNAYNVVDVLQSRKEKHCLAIVRSRCRRHGPGYIQFAVRRTRGDVSSFNPAMADRGRLYPCGYHLSAGRVMWVRARCDVLQSSIRTLDDKPRQQSLSFRQPEDTGWMEVAGRSDHIPLGYSCWTV